MSKRDDFNNSILLLNEVIFELAYACCSQSAIIKLMSYGQKSTSTFFYHMII